MLAAHANQTAVRTPSSEVARFGDRLPPTTRAIRPRFSRIAIGVSKQSGRDGAQNASPARSHGRGIGWIDAHLAGFSAARGSHALDGSPRLGGAGVLSLQVGPGAAALEYAALALGLQTPGPCRAAGMRRAARAGQR